MRALTLALALLWISCRSCPTCPQLPKVAPAPPPVTVIHIERGCLDAAGLKAPPIIHPDAADQHDHTTHSQCDSAWEICLRRHAARAIKGYTEQAALWMAQAYSGCRKDENR